MDKAGVHAAFVAAGLSRLLKDIDDIARPSIRLLTTPVDESTLAIGISKIGGVPDLPSGLPWPECNGLPQSFIAQIRLADVRRIMAAGVFSSGKPLRDSNELHRLHHCRLQASLKPAPSGVPTRSLYLSTPSLMYPTSIGQTTNKRTMKRCSPRFPILKTMPLFMIGSWGSLIRFRMICVSSVNLSRMASPMRVTLVLLR